MMKQIFFFLTLFILVSCDNYLDLKSSNRLAVPVTLEDLQALLDNQVFMNERRTPSIGQASDDDSFLEPQAYDRFFPEEKIFYRWQPIEYFYSNDWSAAYHAVYTANYCLEMLERIEKTEQNKQEWDNVYGSALFYKAYYYLGLLWVFADVYDPSTANDSRGIVLRNSSDFNVQSQFSTVQESYDHIIELLHQAISSLPELPLVKTRPSKWAVNALFARLYLSMSKYNDALHYADETLSIEDLLMDFNNPEHGINIDANIPFRKFTRETIFYSDMTIKFRTHLPANGALVDPALYNSFEDNDLRKRAYYMPSGTNFRFKGTHSNSINWLFSGLTTAEILLIRAECRIRNGDIDGGLEDVHVLRKHRYDQKYPLDGLIGLGQKDALLFVLSERRKELTMRGIRWSDLKRLNKEGYEIRLKRQVGDEIFYLEPNSEQYRLPLPKDLERFF